jgi:hypothetical protein
VAIVDIGYRLIDINIISHLLIGMHVYVFGAYGTVILLDQHVIPPIVG